MCVTVEIAGGSRVGSTHTSSEVTIVVRGASWALDLVQRVDNLFVAAALAWHLWLLWPASPARLGSHRSLHCHLCAVPLCGFWVTAVRPRQTLRSLMPRPCGTCCARISLISAW